MYMARTEMQFAEQRTPPKRRGFGQLNFSTRKVKACCAGHCSGCGLLDPCHGSGDHCRQKSLWPGPGALAGMSRERQRSRVWRIEIRSVPQDRCSTRVHPHAIDATGESGRRPFAGPAA